jgi:uncharacterized protein (TIRG00374 family)
MDNRWKNIITAFFLIGGIVALYFILRGHSLKAIFDTYRHFNIYILLLYIFTVALIMAALTWRWDVVLKSRNVKVPFINLYIYRIIGTSINFLTPGPRVGGEPTQATLLTKHGVDFHEGLSTIVIDKIIDVTTSGLLFIIGVVLVALKYSFPEDTQLPLILGGIVFVVLVIMFYYRMLTNRHFFLNIFRFLKLDRIKALHNIESSIERVEVIMIEFYANNSKAFLKSLTISISTWILMFFEYKFATTLLGLNLGVIEIFFIVSFIGMALLFPIPMAVGVLEAGQLSAFALIHLSASAAIALAFLVRMKDILWAIVGLILLATYGFHPTVVVSKKYKRA